MAFSPISKVESINPVTTINNWVDRYKEAYVESQHDLAQLSLILPDDSLIVAGPPRLSMADSDSSFHIIGFVQDFQHTEGRNNQYIKALGSRRHIPAATNAPVQGSCNRMLFLGRNFINAVYATAEFGDNITDRNTKYDANGVNGTGAWWMNFDEDVFRVPFGLGIIYNSPASLAGSGTSVQQAAAEYIECCTFTTRSVALQAGQAWILESVQFIGDRVVPWEHGGSLTFDSSSMNSPVSEVMGA